MLVSSAAALLEYSNKVLGSFRKFFRLRLEVPAVPCCGALPVSVFYGTAQRHGGDQHVMAHGTVCARRILYSFLVQPFLVKPGSFRNTPIPYAHRLGTQCVVFYLSVL